MVFFGIVVRPGTPFTLSDNRRLHLSQATLGVGSATTKSILQCNVGDRAPVYLCTLVPDKTESCQLNLKYEEADEVVFSVIGSLPVHLTGYYEENVPDVNVGDSDDKTESYGEDLRDTETERSESDEEDEYGEDSFINDDSDIEVIPPSPAAIFDAEIDGTSRKKKCRRLKKCRISESDNDICSPKLSLLNAEVDETSGRKKGRKLMKCHISESDNDNYSPATASRKLLGGVFDVSDSEDSEEEDGMPIGTLIKNRKASKGLSFDDDAERVAAKANNQETQYSDPVTLCQKNDLAGLKPESNAGMEIGTGLEHVRDGQLREATSSTPAVDNLPLHDPPQVESEETVKDGDSQVPKLESKMDEPPNGKASLEVGSGETGKSSGAFSDGGLKMDHRSHHLEGAEETLENSMDEVDGFIHTLPLSTQSTSDDGGQKKQRRKRKRKTKDICSRDVSKVDKGLENGPEYNMTTVDLLGNIENLDNNGVSVVDEVKSCLESQHKERKKKKRSKADRKNAEMVLGLQCSDKREVPVSGKLTNIKTLSNGLVIEEQEVGDSDSKEATLGKKVSVRYVLKSLQSGQVLHSNLDEAPLKLKLGAKGSDGWELGIEGMRVGGKRRIPVPPSSGEGVSGEAAADMSLVYDVELIKVR